MSEHELVDQRLCALQAENERLRAELARLSEEGSAALLSKREALLVEAERVAHLGSWTWDLRTDEIEWSDEFYRILGIPPRSVPPTSERFFEAVHVEDRSRVSAEADTSVATGEPSWTDFRIVRPSGEIRYLRLHASPMCDSRGKPLQVVGAVLDLTSVRRTRTQMTRMLDELRHAERVARMGSWVWDRVLDRMHWSDGFYRLLGLTGDEAPSTELFDQFVHPDDLAQVRQARRELTEKAKAPPEFRLFDTSGRELTMSTEVQAIRDEEGQICGFRGVLQDISHHRELEAQVQRAQKMEAIGRLAGGVAHDFNNYLMVIAAHAEWLLEAESLEAGPHESLRAIERACARCAELTNQLVTFSRKRAANPELIDLAEFIDGVAPMLHSLLGEASSLEVQPGSEPAYVRIDPALLEQALINLVVNARDAMSAGGTVTISVDVVIGELPGDSVPDERIGPLVRLSVSDTGEGIPEAHLSQIFEPFFTTKEVGRGTGLGLATTYAVVSDSGGHVTVDSVVGRGTTFTIYLPHESAADSTQVEARKVRARRPIDRGQGRILLVEDVAEVREVIRRQLERAGFEVVIANDGEHALEHLEQIGGRIDLVLSDVVMPRLGGVELEARIRKLYPGVRCVLMTGYSEEASVPRDSDLFVLRKPFSASEVVARVGELCDR